MWARRVGSQGLWLLGLVAVGRGPPGPGGAYGFWAGDGGPRSPLRAGQGRGPGTQLLGGWTPSLSFLLGLWPGRAATPPPCRPWEWLGPQHCLWTLHCVNLRCNVGSVPRPPVGAGTKPGSSPMLQGGGHCFLGPLLQLLCEPSTSPLFNEPPAHGGDAIRTRGR